jgi:hypothetical protein
VNLHRRYRLHLISPRDAYLLRGHIFWLRGFGAPRDLLVGFTVDESERSMAIQTVARRG